MNLKLLFSLIFGVFSLNPKNMRFFNLKRFMMVLLLFPIFISFLIINKTFLYIDYLVVPCFRKEKIKDPIFIVSTPRSGTTYLYHSIVEYSNKFTYFKLWEIVFAPSIIQKYIFINLLKMDKSIGSPIKKVILYLDNKLFTDLKTIHLIGINLPEEDEAVLLWDLTSLYLNFFYPDSHFFDELLFFDKKLPKKRSNRIMNSYLNYVRRHNYDFNRNGDKTFISKNPLMMCKLESVRSYFPDAKVIQIIRNPKETLPSTISLNNTLYSLFTSQKPNLEINEKTKAVLIQWYQMADEALAKYPDEQVLNVDFKKLISLDKEAEECIRQFLKDPTFQLIVKMESKKKLEHQSKNQYKKLEQTEFDKVMNQLPFLNKYLKS